MSDKLEAVLVDAIQKTQVGIGEAVDFAITQAPDVIKQLLLWKTIESIAQCMVGILLFVCVYLFVRFVKSYPQPESWRDGNIVWWDKGELHPCTAIFGGIAVATAMVSGVCLMNITWLKIMVAPKLYLVEYAASLVK